MRLALAVPVVALVLLTAGWLWLRDSSLVSVDRVTVTGTDGPDAGQIRLALTAAAQRMTTLDVSEGRLRSAVAQYSVVAGLRVSTQFPHKLRIRVIERTPVGMVAVGGQQVPVSSDGMLLRDVSGGAMLPTLSATLPVGASRVTSPVGQQEVALLAAAPYQVVSRLGQVTSDSVHGLTAEIRGGPSIYFGDGSRLPTKWTAASDVLADPGSQGASYIDVTDPGRPAAGSGNDQAGGGSSSGGPASGVSGAGSGSGASGGLGPGSSGAG